MITDHLLDAEVEREVGETFKKDGLFYYRMEASLGSSIDRFAKEARLVAQNRGVIVEFDFNGVICHVDAHTNTVRLSRDYSNAHIMKWKTVGPYCPKKYQDKVQRQIDAYRRKISSQRKSYRREKAPYIMEFTPWQLICVVDGRVTTTIDDVYTILSHVAGMSLHTHHLSVASSYLKENPPTWYKTVEKMLKDAEELCPVKERNEEQFNWLRDYFADKNEPVEVYKLTKSEQKPFGEYMVANSLLLKRQRK